MGTTQATRTKQSHMTGKRYRGAAIGARMHLAATPAADVSHVELSFDEMVIEGSRRLRDAIYRIHPNIFAPA